MSTVSVRGDTVGMQAGETRIISIPAAEGYGSTAAGSIPANSNLIFVVTLTSICSDNCDTTSYSTLYITTTPADTGSFSTSSARAA